MGRTLAEMFRDHVWPAEALGTVAGQLSCEPCSAMAEAVVAHLRAEGWFVREYEGQLRFFPAESDPDKWVEMVRQALIEKRAREARHHDSADSTEPTNPVTPGHVATAPY